MYAISDFNQKTVEHLIERGIMISNSKINSNAKLIYIGKTLTFSKSEGRNFFEHLWQDQFFNLQHEKRFTYLQDHLTMMLLGQNNPMDENYIFDYVCNILKIEDFEHIFWELFDSFEFGEGLFDCSNIKEAFFTFSKICKCALLHPDRISGSNLEKEILKLKNSKNMKKNLLMIITDIHQELNSERFLAISEEHHGNCEKIGNIFLFTEFPNIDLYKRSFKSQATLENLRKTSSDYRDMNLDEYPCMGHISDRSLPLNLTNYNPKELISKIILDLKSLESSKQISVILGSDFGTDCGFIYRYENIKLFFIGTVKCSSKKRVSVYPTCIYSFSDELFGVISRDVEFSYSKSSSFVNEDSILTFSNFHGVNFVYKNKELFLKRSISVDKYNIYDYVKEIDNELLLCNSIPKTPVSKLTPSIDKRQMSNESYSSEEEKGYNSEDDNYSARSPSSPPKKSHLKKPYNIGDDIGFNFIKYFQNKEHDLHVFVTGGSALFLYMLSLKNKLIPLKDIDFCIMGLQDVRVTYELLKKDIKKFCKMENIEFEFKEDSSNNNYQIGNIILRNENQIRDINYFIYQIYVDDLSEIKRLLEPTLENVLGISAISLKEVKKQTEQFFEDFKIEKLYYGEEGEDNEKNEDYKNLLEKYQRKRQAYDQLFKS